MRFFLLVEGFTEEIAIGLFLKRWLDARLEAPVRIKAYRHDGWSHLVDNLPKTVKLLSGKASKQDRAVGIVALLDLYGPTFYPDGIRTVSQRFAWGRSHFEKLIDDPSFRLFFAVHEIEAWLLSDPSLFPPDVRKALPGRITKPEEVNFNEHPATLLDKTYKKAKGRPFDKIKDGADMLGRLNPEVAYEKCPHLRILLDEMLEMAQANRNPN